MTKKKSSTTKQSPITVRLPTMIPRGLLFEHASNSQRQSKHEHEELRRSIRENGFDESLLVVPREDGEGYNIVAGNHRFKGGSAEGMTEFPCVIRDDWDAVKTRIELVRRNYVRGKLDKDAFTSAVAELRDEHGMAIDDIMEQMGFEDADKFAVLFREEKEREEQIEREIASSDAGVIKMIDDLGLIISAILNKYGDTVPHSFIIFPTGGKHHLFIASNPALKKTMEQIAGACVSQHLDINVALAGILAIGLAQTNFVNGEGKSEILEEVDSVDGSSDIEVVL